MTSALSPTGTDANEPILGSLYLHLRHLPSGPVVDGTPTAFFGHPEGPWARWAWDGAELVVETDPLGHIPLYRWDGPDEVAVSDSVLTLLERGAPADLDLPALAVFLRLGYFVGDDTPFAAVRAVGPPPPIVSPSGLGRDDAIEGFLTLFRDAVRRRLPDRGRRHVVALSGGMDSRHVLLELVAAGQPPTDCVTARHFPPRGDADVGIADAVTGALGLPHDVVAVPRSRHAIELRKQRWTGFATPSMAWTVPLADHLAGRADVVFDGLGGDVLAAGLEDEDRIRLYADGRLEELARLLLARRHQDTALDQVLTATARRQLGFEVAVDHLVPHLAPHLHAANPLGSFWFWNRNRRELASRPFSVLARSADVVTPFLDQELHRHLASLAPTITSAVLPPGDFHAEAIRRGHPEAPEVPYVHADRGRRDPRGYRRFAVETAGYALRQPSALVRRGRAVGQLLRRVVDGHQALRRDLLTLHLLHLERVADRSHPLPG